MSEYMTKQEVRAMLTGMVNKISEDNSKALELDRVNRVKERNEERAEDKQEWADKKDETLRNFFAAHLVGGAIQKVSVMDEDVCKKLFDIADLLVGEVHHRAKESK